MNANLPHYLSGREIHAGDRVRYHGYGYNVIFVSDGDTGEFSPGYTDYLGCDPGIMLLDDDGQMTFLTEAGEDLEFVHPVEVTLM